MWSLLLYSSVSIALISFVWIRLREEGRPYFHFLLSGAILSSVLSSWIGLESISGDASLTAAFYMGALTLIMVWITTVIWNLKPVYARYPIAFTWSPALLLAGFPWIASIPTLMSLFFLVIESGILLILFLLWLSLRKRIQSSVWFLLTLGLGVILWIGNFIHLFETMPWLSYLIRSFLLPVAYMTYKILIESIPEFQKQQSRNPIG